MVDVESMYYQVKVPDNQQAFLKFLWSNNGNLLEEPWDFVMCAHVFGGISSVSCSNYALRRSAVNNESIFGKAASEALQKNFYVDDLLKFSKDMKSAKELVKDVMNVCKAGGFFTSQISFQTRRSYFYQSQKAREELVSKIKIYQVNFQMRRQWEFAGKLVMIHSPSK